MALFLVICAPFLIRIFYTAEFEPAIPAVRLLGLSLIFMSLSNTFGTNWMIIEGHARILRNITLIVSLIGFGLSFLLIVNYGFIGATLTIVICRCLLGSVISLKALRLKHIQRHNAHEAL